MAELTPEKLVAAHKSDTAVFAVLAQSVLNTLQELFPDGIAKVPHTDKASSPKTLTNGASGKVRKFRTPNDDTFEPIAKNLVGRIGHKLVPAAGTKLRSLTAILTEEFGSRPVTYMMHFVILQHVHTFGLKKFCSVRSILDELCRAKLLDENQRGSLVTSLNRLKKEKGLLFWQDSTRAENIQITTEGKKYLVELAEKRLGEREVAYLKKNARSLAVGLKSDSARR